LKCVWHWVSDLGALDYECKAAAKNWTEPLGGSTNRQGPAGMETQLVRNSRQRTHEHNYTKSRWSAGKSRDSRSASSQLRQEPYPGPAPPYPNLTPHFRPPDPTARPQDPSEQQAATVSGPTHGEGGAHVRGPLLTDSSPRTLPPNRRMLAKWSKTVGAEKSWKEKEPIRERQKRKGLFVPSSKDCMHSLSADYTLPPKERPAETEAERGPG
ncbi:hypothetical protein BaRGS_00005785, partial [Batillaria attramentaria]